MGTFLEDKVLQKSKFQKKTFNKSLSPSPMSYILHRIFLVERFDQFSTLKNDFENQNFEMLEEVVHNFGKSDGDIK